jgi:hypothetical protein
MTNEFVKTYDLKQDNRKIVLIQKATLETKDSGLVPQPALFGSATWWRAIENNVIPVHMIEGIISRVYMSGHNDYPEFEIDDGREMTQWTREGKDEAYVVGRQIKLIYVLQTPKRFGGKDSHKVVLEIWMSASDKK